MSVNWFLKIPGIEIQQWAPHLNWERLFGIWQNSGFAGIVIPVSLNDQLNGFFDRIQTLVERAQKRDLQSWIIFPVLNNPVYFYRYPNARPVHRESQRFSFPNWFSPICPSDEHYLRFFLNSVNNLLKKLPCEVFLLDYLRVPYFWEEWGNDIKFNQWPPYCYCDRCKDQFEIETQKNYQEAEPEEWIQWQGNLLSNCLEMICKTINTSRSFAQIGVQLLPLRSYDKGQVYTHWIGQNLQKMQKHIHFFSPLVYDKLLNWNEDTVLSFLVNLMEVQRLPVVPSFQISKIKWDRKKENDFKLMNLIDRLQPLNIREATVFHARELLTEKDIRFHLG